MRNNGDDPKLSRGWHGALGALPKTAHQCDIDTATTDLNHGYHPCPAWHTSVNSRVTIPDTTTWVIRRREVQQRVPLVWEGDRRRHVGGHNLAPEFPLEARRH